MICNHCHMDVTIRNPSGFCDHLYYPDNCDVCSKSNRDKERIRDAAPDLLEACIVQQESLNILFSLLVDTIKDFKVTKSGKPWEALGIGWKAISKAEGKEV